MATAHVSASASSSVQSFISKMEQVDNLIKMADAGYSSSYLISKEDYASGMAIVESGNLLSQGRFSMGIDSWGTSVRRVGP